MVALPLGLPPLSSAARVQRECHHLHGDVRPPGGKREKCRSCHAQVVCAATGSASEVRERYGSEVLAWLEADQSANEHAGRPQPTLDVADAGSDIHGQSGVQTHLRPATAAAQPADLPAWVSPNGARTPAAGPAGSTAHGSISAAAAPPPPQTAPQNSAPAAGRSATGRLQQAATVEAAAGPPPAPPPAARSHWRFFAAGAVMAVILHTALHWAMQLPLVRRLISRFIWMKPSFPWATSSQPGDGTDREPRAVMKYSGDAESVEWFNMAFRKIWRVYLRGLERWLADLLQPVFDGLVAARSVPRFVQRLKVVEFTLDHEAPVFSNMRRRTSRKDSDLNGVVDIRYTGGARMLLLIELGRRKSKMRIKVPVLVSELDLECKLWIKLRLAPLPPHVGTISLAFVGQPTVRVQLAPYNRVRLMRIPILQAFLTRLLTVDLPGLMVLPLRLEIGIPPGLTSVAEAAVGRDAVMRAVASAVLQSDALEHALIAALPLGPQSPAGGVTLPDSFKGELQVSLISARSLPVWGFPWTSNPWCRLTLGTQAENSRRDDDTSHAGRHRAPVWNQEFQFLVEDPANQTLDIQVRDSHLTGRPLLGDVSFPLSRLPADGTLDAWLPVMDAQPLTAPAKPVGDIHLKLTYKAFEEDEADAEYREKEALALAMQEAAITDVKSFTQASSRAAVAATAAATAVAVTKAAAARAAAKAARRARARLNGSSADDSRVQGDGDGANGRATGETGTVKVQSREQVAVAADNGSSNGSGSSTDEDAISLLPADAATPLGDEATPSGDAMVAGRSLDEWSERLFPDVSMRVTDAYDEDSPYSRAVQDAVEKADIAGLSSAVEQLGLGASRSRDAADGGKTPQAQQAAEQIARQAAQRAAADIASHQLSDSGLESDSDAELPTDALGNEQRPAGEDHAARAPATADLPSDGSASEDSDEYSEGESEAAGIPNSSPTEAMIQRARHGTAKQAADRSLARTAAQFGADAERNGSNGKGSTSTTRETTSRNGTPGAGPSSSAQAGDMRTSVAAEVAQVPHKSRLPAMPASGSAGKDGSVMGLEVDVVDPTRASGERVLGRARQGGGPRRASDSDSDGSADGSTDDAGVDAAARAAAAAPQGAAADEAAVGSPDGYTSDYVDELIREAEAEIYATSDDGPSDGVATDRLPPGGTVEAAADDPAATAADGGVDPAAEASSSGDSWWSRISGGAVAAGGAVAEGAVGAWGGIKGWTADRLARSSSSSLDEGDEADSNDEDGDEGLSEEERKERRRRRRREREAEAVYARQLEDLPLEDIAKEMQDSWQLKEDQVERLLESAVAKSERPWLILLSGLATVVIALLVFLGLRIDGVF